MHNPGGWAALDVKPHPSRRLIRSSSIANINVALGLAVGQVGRVAALEIGIVEVDPAKAGRQAAQRHHARIVGGAQQWQQVGRQCEMAEVVAAELQLEPVSGGVALGRLHHAGVVDQDVDRAAFCVQFRTEFGDAGQRGQVEVLDGQFGVGGPRRGMSAIAASPLARLRIAMTTSAPAAAKRLVTPSPSPLLEPVTTASFPERSGGRVRARSVMPATLTEQRSDNKRTLVC